MPTSLAALCSQVVVAARPYEAFRKFPSVVSAIDRSVAVLVVVSPEVVVVVDLRFA